jgi:hypothetical protein
LRGFGGGVGRFPFGVVVGNVDGSGVGDAVIPGAGISVALGPGVPGVPRGGGVGGGVAATAAPAHGEAAKSAAANAPPAAKAAKNEDGLTNQCLWGSRRRLLFDTLGIMQRL